MGSNWNKELDFSALTSSTLIAVDGLRSKGKTGQSATESRINAFYRAIGLPAVVPSSYSDEQKKLIPKSNNGNSFDNYSLDSQKESKLQLRGLVGSMRVEDEEVKKFLDLNRAKVKDSMAEDNTVRKRGGLRPMVVDDTVEIWPVSKRVVQAFSSKDNLMTSKLKRPFIETVISLRLKMDGIQNSSQQNRANEFQEFVGAANAVSDAAKDLGESLKETLLSSFGNVKLIIDKVPEITGRIKRYLSESPDAQENNTAESKTKMKSGDGNGELEQAITQQEIELFQKEAIISIFDFDDTFGEDSKSSTSRNIKDPLLSTQLLGLIIPKKPPGIVKLVRGNIEKSNKENTKKLKKMRVELRAAYRDLDLALGTFSGLSGPDILAIMTAMFTIDLNVLISLLNDKGRRNLAKFLGSDSLDGLFSLVPSTSAVSTLETEVAKHLTTMDDDVQTTKSRNKSTTQASRRR